MLRLQTPTAEVQPKRRTQSPLLGITWLQGRFQAARGGAEGETVWTAAGLVRTETELRTGLREAVAALGPGIQKVVFLLAHSHLVPVHLDLPDASPAMLRQILPREVERQKPFPEAAVWWEQQESSLRRPSARLLHLLAKSVHEGISRACASEGLRLESIIPVSEAIRSLDSAASGDGAILLRAVVLPEGLAIVASEGNGVLLVRSVRLASLEPERTVQELRRTLTYLQEQFQVSVGRIRIFRLGGASFPLLLNSQVGVPLECPDLADTSWFEWLQTRGDTSAIRFTSGLNGNAGQTSGFERWSRLGCLFSGIGFLAVGALEWSLWRTRDELKSARDQQSTLEASVRKRGEVREGHRQARELLSQWNRTRRSPLPIWLPALLGSELPSSWVLHQMDLQADSSGWTVRLEGGGSFPGVPYSESELEGILARLANSPLQATVQSSNPPDRPSVVPVTRQSWSQRLQLATPETKFRRDRFDLVLRVP